MNVLPYALAGAAIVVMGLNVVAAVRLRRAIVGGEVGQKWGVLTGLVAVFFACYLASPLAIWYAVPPEHVYTIAFGVFLFGAIFVWVVIGIIRDTLGFLKLLR
ncbi:MAG: hypothetical protein U0229_10715 [Anaeromyxobacter sp.]